VVGQLLVGLELVGQLVVRKLVVGQLLVRQQLERQLLVWRQLVDRPLELVAEQPPRTASDRDRGHTLGR